MRSLKFPKMFNTNSSNVWASKDYLKQTKQNTVLLISSTRGELECDPYFGTTIKKKIFEQNNSILKDQLIDIIYNQIAMFIPQVVIERKDVNVIQNEAKGQVTVQFKGTSQIDFTTDLYSLTIFEDRE